MRLFLPNMLISTQSKHKSVVDWKGVLNDKVSHRASSSVMGMVKPESMELCTDPWQE